MTSCAYWRRPSDGRTRCRKPAIHRISTQLGGMTTDVCAEHLERYLSHGWHLISAEPATRCERCGSPLSARRPGRCINAGCGRWEGPR